MGQLEAATVGQLGVLFELASALNNLVSANVQTAIGMQYLTGTTNESVESYQRWILISHQAGMAGDEITGTMKSINDQIERGHAIGDWGKLITTFTGKGINLTGDWNKNVKSAEDLFNIIRKNPQFQELPGAMQALLEREAFGTDKLFKLLNAKELPTSKIDEVLRTIGPVQTNAQMKEFVKIGQQSAEVGDQLTTLGRIIATFVAPGVSAGLDKLITFLTLLRGATEAFEKVYDAHPKVTGAIKEGLGDTIGAIFHGLIGGPVGMKRYVAGLADTAEYSAPVSVDRSLLTIGRPQGAPPQYYITHNTNIPISTKLTASEIRQHINTKLDLEWTRIYHNFGNSAF